MIDRILIRYGDLNLKGKNHKFFVRQIESLIREKVSPLPVTFDFRHDRAYVILNGTPSEEVEKRLSYVTGVHSFSRIGKTKNEIGEIASLSSRMLKETYGEKTVTFKVETKRADKTIPHTSIELSQMIAKKVLRQCSFLEVDVHDPEEVLNVEMRRDGAYMYTDKTPGLGGFPVGINGKALSLVSGGIDSPVASFLMMKEGIEVELVHFESSPMTPVESVQKVIDISEKLAAYAPGSTIRLHLVPFEPLHQTILNHTPEAYIITIMRRMMIRIATRLKQKIGALTLVTGDSLGQVASQTQESLVAIQDVTDAVIVRPLATMDKREIMDIAETIETIDISNRPFSDCCAVYVPKNPVIRPSVNFSAAIEENADYETLVKQCVDGIITIDIHADRHLDISDKGLTIKEVFDETP